MSIFWRKEFDESAYRSIMKRFDGSIPLCDACICPESFYIATLCSSEICGNDRCAAGLPCSYPTAAEDPLYDESVAGEYVTIDGIEKLWALTLPCELPQDASDGEPVAAFPTTVSGVGCMLFAVKHTTPAAPFDGTIAATVYLNGVKVGFWIGDCVEGVAQKVGNQIFDEGVPYAAIMTGTTSGGTYTFSSFTEKGVSTVDIRIVWTATDTVAHPNPAGYTCRTAVRVLDSTSFAPEIDTIGEVGIIPGWYLVEEDYSSFFSPFSVDVEGVTVRLGIFGLKGPFSTFSKAKYVLDEFRDQITDYAETCACRREFRIESVWCVVSDGSDPPGWVEDVCTSAHQNCVESEVPYWRKLRWNFWDLPDGWEAELIVNGVTYSASNYANEYGNGIIELLIPPCATVHERVYVDDVDHFNEPFCVHWTCEIIGQQDCKFCSNFDFNRPSTPDYCAWHLEDNYGNWLSDWDYTDLASGGPGGVPANDSDLEDYIEAMSI